MQGDTAACNQIEFPCSKREEKKKKLNVVLFPEDIVILSSKLQYFH